MTLQDDLAAAPLHIPLCQKGPHRHLKALVTGGVDYPVKEVNRPSTHAQLVFSITEYLFAILAIKIRMPLVRQSPHTPSGALDRAHLLQLGESEPEPTLSVFKERFAAAAGRFRHRPDPSGSHDCLVHLVSMCFTAKGS